MKVKIKSKMIPGYSFIERQSPEHEPNIVGTRLTIAHIVGDCGLSRSAIDKVVATYKHCNLTPEKVEEALRYYRDNKAEIDGYIAESRARSGMIIKEGKVVKKPDGV